MKVLHINCSVGGSIGRIIESINQYLSAHESESFVVFGLGSKQKSRSCWKVTYKHENGVNKRVAYYFTGLAYGFSPRSTFVAKRIITKESPDIIHIHCPNGFMINVYSLIAWLNQRDYPLVITNHCEMFYTANCPHSFECQQWLTGCKQCNHHRDYVGLKNVNNTALSFEKMMQALDSYRKIAVVSVSKWVYERSLKSPLLGQFDNYLIHNGINTGLYYFKPECRKADYFLRKGIGHSKIVLFVTPIFSTNGNNPKGGHFLVELAKRHLSDSIVFMVIGASNEELNLPNNVLHIGRVEDETVLSSYYSIADLTIVLSKKETFSMVCAESLCCGTPVIGFKSGGPESIALPGFSEFCQYGDVEAIDTIMIKWLRKATDDSMKSLCSEMAIEQFKKERMCNSYFEVYQSLLR